MFAATRSHYGGLAVLVALLYACVSGSAWAAVPGGYAVQPLDPPGPASGTLNGARAGDAVLNAGDVDSDGTDDVLVAAPSAPISVRITGRVYMYSGATGGLLWQAEAPSPQGAAVDDPTRFGAALARLGDIGRCAFAGASCGLNNQLDGAAEVLVSAPGTDVDSDTGRDEGVVYVLDGATGRTLKELRLSAAERPAFGSGGFGKAVSALAGQPPCAGFGGIGPCLEPPSSAVAIGDVNGGGKPDFVVGAPDYTELGGNFGGEYPGCPADVDQCPGVGRVYVVLSEAISGSSLTPLDLSSTDNAILVQFPGQAGGGGPPRFGSALTSVGDLGQCTDGVGAATCVGVPASLTNVPDGRPDFVASAPGTDAGEPDAGAAFVVDAAGAAAMLRVDPPTPQGGAEFGSFVQSFPAPGRVDSDTTPDLVVGAPGHDGQGIAHLLGGNVLSADRLIRTYTDPSPVAGGRFGSSLAGLGDISGDGVGEVAMGAPGGPRVGAVHIVSSCARDVVQTIADPDPQSEAGFGTAVAPVGDRNGDGMLDLVVGVPGFDAPPTTDRGRAYLLTSDGPPQAAPSGCGGSTTGGGDGGGGGDEVTPPDEGDDVVIARVLRRLVLKSASKRVRKNATIRLRGTLSASGNRSVCQNRQKIALQRRRASGGRFQTFEVALTRATGKFTARATATRTYVYRARVSQTARCMGAVSKTAKVSILRKSGSR